MGEVSVKMYDKAGVILRIECTSNDVSQFRQNREVQQRDGSIAQKVAPIQKSIYSLFPLIQIFKGVVRRYLEYVSEFDDPSDGVGSFRIVTMKVRSPGLVFSFEPLVVCQSPVLPLAGGTRAAGSC